MQGSIQIPEQQHIKAADFKSLYINTSMMRISFYDISILCGRLTEDGTVDDLVSLTMSPEHAKAFLVGLQTTVKQYEDTFGEIATQQMPTPKS